jgi:hypothetical protein
MLFHEKCRKKTQVILATVLVAEKFLIDALSGLLPKPMKLSKSVLPGFAAMILELPLGIKGHSLQCLRTAMNQNMSKHTRGVP